MRQLVETEFYHADALPSTEVVLGGVNTGTTTTADSASLSAWTLPSPEDMWSGLDQPLFGGLPATLDVDTW